MPYCFTLSFNFVALDVMLELFNDTVSKPREVYVNS